MEKIKEKLVNIMKHIKKKIEQKKTWKNKEKQIVFCGLNHHKYIYIYIYIQSYQNIEAYSYIYI